MKPKQVPAALDWKPLATFSSFVERGDGRSLILTLSLDPLGARQGWFVAAIQTEVSLRSLSTPSEAFDRVGDNHAHQNVGTYDTPAEAFLAAESYARSWLAKHKASAIREDCGCGPIK
jgi:hypothetical protein